MHAGDDLVLKPAQEPGQDEEQMVGIFFTSTPEDGDAAIDYHLDEM